MVRHGFYTFNLQSTPAIIIKYRGNTETLELPLCQAERNKVLKIDLAFLFLILLSTPAIIIEYRGNIRNVRVAIVLRRKILGNNNKEKGYLDDTLNLLSTPAITIKLKVIQICKSCHRIK